MGEQDWLAGRFEEDRTHLRTVAYRLLGSLSEADGDLAPAQPRRSRRYSEPWRIDPTRLRQLDLTVLND